MASEPGPPAVRFHAITAAVLLAALIALYAIFELAHPQKTLAEGALPLPAHPASAAVDDPGVDPAQMTFTPELDVEGPTTLVVEVERSEMDGWVGVGVSLLDRDTGEVRQLALGTEWTRRARGGGRGSLHASARVDEVPSGTWIARLEPAWEPDTGARRDAAEVAAATPPSATFRIRQERRSPIHFWIAAGLVVLPAVVQIGRHVWYTRRRKAGEATGGDR